MDENAKELQTRVERLFTKKLPLDQLNQELAMNFYPERADFTAERALGDEFAIDLFDGTPLRARRDLGNARASMLRPGGHEWFKVSLRDERLNKNREVAKALDRVNATARTLIYEQTAGFVRAQKEGDQDIVTFGNSVKSFEATMPRRGPRRLLCRSWHLRDCVWLDNEDGTAQDFFARKFKASARHIKSKFPGADLHDDIKNALNNNDPDKEFEVCHVMMLSDEYGYYTKPAMMEEYASIYYDTAHKSIFREGASERFRYVIDRWQTLSGSQYAVSPAALASVADARGMQELARIIMEAGEKALDPSLKATKGAVIGEVNQAAGDITWVDRDYDEREGPAIEPLLPGNINLAAGHDLLIRATLSMNDSWYLTKLTLPQRAKTAYETEQLLEEYIRANVPLFEPWEAGTEADLKECFAVLSDMHAFGTAADLPPEMLGEGVDLSMEFKFTNPLRAAIERNRSNQATATLGLLAGAIQVDENARYAVDVIVMTQSAVRGLGSPADWTPDLEKVREKVDAEAQMGSVLKGIGMADQAAGVVGKGLDAAQQLQDLTAPSLDRQIAYGPT